MIKKELFQNENIQSNNMLYLFLKTLNSSDKSILKNNSFLKFKIELLTFLDKDIVFSIKKELVKNYINLEYKSKNDLLKKDKEWLDNFYNLIENEQSLYYLYLSLELLSLKNIILSHIEFLTTALFIKEENIDELLSLKQDKKDSKIPFFKRVVSVIYLNILFDYSEDILNLFFNEKPNLKQDFINFIEFYKKEKVYVKDIFNLLIQESINQSIKSDSGKDYEEKVRKHLILNGFTNEELSYYKRSKEDNSLELDLVVTLENKKIGIGVKRTLRERYKQFSRLSKNSDYAILIEVTLGIDLTEQKIKNIHDSGVILFITDEIYENLKYKNYSIYSIKNLNKNFLLQLTKALEY